MSCECNTGVVDDSLVHRCCYDRSEFSRYCAIDRSIQQLQHVLRVSRVELTRLGSCFQGSMEDCQRVRLVRAAHTGIVVAQCDPPTQMAGPCSEQVAITETN